VTRRGRLRLLAKHGVGRTGMYSDSLCAISRHAVSSIPATSLPRPREVHRDPHTNLLAPAAGGARNAGRLSDVSRSGDDKGKAPLPDKADVARAADLIRDLFKAEFAKARDDADAGKSLAHTLLNEGKNTQDSAALRYAALDLARELAVQAGDLGTALVAIGELARHHKIDVPALKSAALLGAAAKATATAD